MLESIKNLMGLKKTGNPRPFKGNRYPRGFTGITFIFQV
jgi:hypothetical protein